MDRVEFMRRLEELLADISPTEKEEALQYYSNYFDDAGAENEGQVIEDLGSPERVAENIKSGLFESGIAEIGRQSREGFQPESTRMEGSRAEGSQAGSTQAKSSHTENAYAGSFYTENAYAESSYTELHAAPMQREAKKKTSLSAGVILLIVLLCVFAAPILLPVGIGVLSILFGVLVAWFTVIFVFGVVAVALFAMLVFFFIIGGMCLVTDPLVSVALMGGGLVCGGIGILFLMLTVAMAGIATPAIFRGIGWLFRPRRRAAA